MELSKAMQSALNEQIKNEIYSAYFYLSMSAHCDAENLPGAASWLRLQWKEELSHAERLMNFVGRRGGRVTLEAIDQPPTAFQSLLDIFSQVLAHERKVTGMINLLYERASEEKDYATATEMQWFVTEQVEEEESASNILEMLKMIGDNKPALVMLDRQLGSRQAGA